MVQWPLLDKKHKWGIYLGGPKPLRFPSCLQPQHDLASPGWHSEEGREVQVGKFPGVSTKEKLATLGSLNKVWFLEYVVLCSLPGPGDVWRVHSPWTQWKSLFWVKVSLKGPQGGNDAKLTLKMDPKTNVLWTWFWLGFKNNLSKYNVISWIQLWSRQKDISRDPGEIQI